MAPFKPMEDWEKPFFSDKMHACPLRGHWVSFRLVDEFGDGTPYAGLAYEVTDSVGQTYSGTLDAEGFGKVEDCFRGPVTLSLLAHYQGTDDFYTALQERESYPLPITELQVRAEQTRFFHQDGARREHNPAQAEGSFCQVEVRDLVKHAAHLPPRVPCKHPPVAGVLAALASLGFGPEDATPSGVGLLPNQHHVLEVRPLRALRPVLSTDNRFSALNLYQLALLATMSYNDFGQEPAQPVDSVSFPLAPSFGNWFGEVLACGTEGWRVDKGQRKRYFPLYEDVPYSKRFEILPFDPGLYPQNAPALGDEQEHPGNRHFFDHGRSQTDTQAFISHHDEIILISVRGTGSVSFWETLVDAWRDADARQVPFKEGVGKAHRGFYEAYLATKEFILLYLDQFHAGQKIIICGHSLGGAIALLLAEALRRIPGADYDILLYTYGAPRAGDAELIEGARELMHHRMVNNDDPVPSVPAPWMNVRRNLFITGLIKVFSNPVFGALAIVIGLVRVGGRPYGHHGDLQHFMPVSFREGELSSILWAPGCESIEEAACTRMVDRNGDMPQRAAFVRQLMSAGDHSMVGAYIPNAWATLRRWQQAQEGGLTVVSEREFALIDAALTEMKARLDQVRRERMASYRTERQANDEQALIAQLYAESQRLETARQRLATLRTRRLTPEDVYGSVAGTQMQADSLERWMAHPENTAQVQLAMIPKQLEDDDRLMASIMGIHDGPLDVDSYT